MSRYFYFLLIIVVPVFYSSCTSDEAKVDSLSFIKDLKAKDLLSRAIAGSGGLANWEAHSEFEFRKAFSLYLENGEVENTAVQDHHYNFAEPKQVTINWGDERNKHLLQSTDGKISKTTNGQIDTSFSAQRAENIILSSTFVMRLPYNLIDRTASFIYGGKDKLANGEAIEILQVSYNPEQHKNHSTQDIWWLYFSEESAELLGYMVKHADHYSYVENTATNIVNGLLMPLTRKSWRVDSLRNPLYLRADYKYTY